MRTHQSRTAAVGEFPKQRYPVETISYSENCTNGTERPPLGSPTTAGVKDL